MPRRSPPSRQVRRRVGAQLCTAWLLGVCSAASVVADEASPPRVLVDGYRLELVASEPEITTPVGMAFDAQGRLLVIESHTHQRPDDYNGPESDQVKMLADSDGDGTLDRWSTFAEGFQQAMNVLARSDGWVYVVTRRDVQLLRDSDGDGKADVQKTLLSLETTDDYPHNAISGIALDQGEEPAVLYLGVGENSGVQYKLIGSDGASFVESSGAGNVFVCTPDGEGLRRLATGFWNPFSLCMAGRKLFCVDNDPDSSPPCRLIAVAPAGDYGFRYQYGRAGIHPLQAWNGELPGTLPMVCGTGEAPTAVIHHAGGLWVTSWGDHRIERYTLRASDQAPGGLQPAMQVVVQGEADFRPTGAALAPDGSIYFADWVDLSYPVHGKGRIWRIVPSEPTGNENGSGAVPWSEWSDGPVDRRQERIAADAALPEAPARSRSADAPARLESLEALRWRGTGEPEPVLREALGDADGAIRLFAVRWIADEKIKSLRDEVANLLDGEIPDERYFLAVLAAVHWLDGDGQPPVRNVSDKLLLRELKNSRRSPQLHALALRLVSTEEPSLAPLVAEKFFTSSYLPLRIEAVRWWASRQEPERFAALEGIAGDRAQDASLRVEAVAGLAGGARELRPTLANLADDENAAVAREAQRVLRLTSDNPADASGRPPATDLEGWMKLTGEGGDPAAGRRLFFLQAGPQCANCHQHRGRGGRVGPDLTRLGRQQSRARIVASILQPSGEVAPQYQPWTLLSSDGQGYLGLRMPKAGDDGEEVYVDVDGREFRLRSDEIDLRQPSDKSIMPDGLEQMLSVEDVRDLAAFLSAAE